MEDLKRYNTKFQYYVEERQLSYGVLAAVTKIPKSTLYNYAMGRRTPDIYVAFKIAETLRLDPNEIKVLFKPYFGQAFK